MAIRYHNRAEPFSLRAQQDSEMEPLLARSHAGQVLEGELRRYCGGLVRGRSFLISGHRGSGKTTMVDDAVLRLQREAVDGLVGLKPLPVYLQGPTLFAPEPKPDDKRRARAGSPLVNVNVSAASPAPATAAAADAAAADDMNLVLIQVVQALHLAVSREFGECLHRRARAELGRRSAAAGADLVELAARFQIELTEAPAASRLHEFWRQAELLDDGVLFAPGHRRGRQQGLRELVALVGVNHVHQRISGTLSEKDERLSGASRTHEASVTAESKWGELAKPLSAVFAGTAVAAAGAAGDGLGWAAVLGLLTALGALFVFRVSRTTRTSQERKLDRTFVPDLTIKTLHRVMPELFDRLGRAGLAPVFIVDELDKVDNLDVRIYPLILSLKKLFTELSLTCLLVDRGFYERLHLREQQEKRA